MSKKNIKFLTYLVITIAATFGLTVSFQSLLAQWTAPTANPPGSNAPASINVSGTGQAKAGYLDIGGDFYVGDGAANDVLFVDSVNNKVGIGTTSPLYKLDVRGDFFSDQICLADRCVSTWSEVTAGQGWEDWTVTDGPVDPTGGDDIISWGSNWDIYDHHLIQISCDSGGSWINLYSSSWEQGSCSAGYVMNGRGNCVSLSIPSPSQSMNIVYEGTFPNMEMLCGAEVGKRGGMPRGGICIDSGCTDSFEFIFQWMSATGGPLRANRVTTDFIGGAPACNPSCLYIGGINSYSSFDNGVRFRVLGKKEAGAGWQTASGTVYTLDNVGIGTTTPGSYDGQQVKLDVDGYAAAEDFWIKSIGDWASSGGGNLEFQFFSTTNTGNNGDTDCEASWSGSKCVMRLSYTHTRKPWMGGGWTDSGGDQTGVILDDTRTDGCSIISQSDMLGGCLFWVKDCFNVGYRTLCAKGGGGVGPAMYVGATTAFYDGDLGGYNGANVKCDAEYPGSHMCTAQEILNSFNYGGMTGTDIGSGINGPTGMQRAWYSMGHIDVGVFGNTECRGWTTGAIGAGSTWMTDAGYGNFGNCVDQYEILCCQ